MAPEIVDGDLNLIRGAGLLISASENVWGPVRGLRMGYTVTLAGKDGGSGPSLLGGAEPGRLEGRGSLVAFECLSGAP